MIRMADIKKTNAGSLEEFAGKLLDYDEKENIRCNSIKICLEEDVLKYYACFSKEGLFKGSEIIEYSQEILADNLEDRKVIGMREKKYFGLMNDKQAFNDFHKGKELRPYDVIIERNNFNEFYIASLSYKDIIRDHIMLIAQYAKNTGAQLNLDDGIKILFDKCDFDKNGNLIVDKTCAIPYLLIEKAELYHGDKENMKEIFEKNELDKKFISRLINSFGEYLKQIRIKCEKPAANYIPNKTLNLTDKKNQEVPKPEYKEAIEPSADTIEKATQEQPQPETTEVSNEVGIRPDLKEAHKAYEDTSRFVVNGSNIPIDAKR